MGSGDFNFDPGNHVSREEFEAFKKYITETVSAVAQQGWANQQSIANLTEILESVVQLEQTNWQLFQKNQQLLTEISEKITRLLPPGR
jgi:hypothetical protein